jgi:hypothetical protein
MIMKMMVWAKASAGQDEDTQKLRVPQTCPNPYPCKRRAR